MDLCIYESVTRMIIISKPVDDFGKHERVISSKTIITNIFGGQFSWESIHIFFLFIPSRWLWKLLTHSGSLTHLNSPLQKMVDFHVSLLLN